jgi:hypothetical protein
MAKGLHDAESHIFNRKRSKKELNAKLTMESGAWMCLKKGRQIGE